MGDRSLDPLRVLSIAFTVLIGACVAASPAHASPPEGKGNPHKAPQAASDDAQELVHPAVDYDSIRAVAVAQHHTGYRPLPPGIAKNLARGKPLPPGIAKKGVPDAVLHHLPTYPDYEWNRCGTDLVLVQIASQVAADVVADIFK
jgi:hypothetical protein